MKIIRTANLTILKTWLVGGQVAPMGDHSEGFHIFSPRHEDAYPRTLAKTKYLIKLFIDEYKDEPSSACNSSFEYYNDYYKFKMPSEKNFNILAKRVFEIVKERAEELEHEGAA